MTGTDDGRDQARHVRGLGVLRDDSLPVAENRYAVGDLEDLGQAVRDVDDADSSFGGVLDGREEDLLLATGQ